MTKTRKPLRYRQRLTAGQRHYLDIVMEDNMDPSDSFDKGGKFGGPKRNMRPPACPSNTPSSHRFPQESAASSLYTGSLGSQGWAGLIGISTYRNSHLHEKGRSACRTMQHNGPVPSSSDHLHLR